MTAPRRSRIKVFAFSGVLVALAIATFTRPPRDGHDAVESETATASDDSGAQHAHSGRQRHADIASNDAAGSLAVPTLPGTPAPPDRAEHARAREERLAARAAQRRAWEEREREARSAARARALEQANDDPAQLEYLNAKFALRDERDRLVEARREERRLEREQRAARPSVALPRPSDAPVLGAPVIGEDGVAYDPHARAP